MLASSTGGIPELVWRDDWKNLLVADDARTLEEALAKTLVDGIRPGRLAFDPTLAEIEHLALHAKLVDDARKKRLRPPSPTHSRTRGAAPDDLVDAGPARRAGRYLVRLARSAKYQLRAGLRRVASKPPAASVLMYHSIADTGSPQTSRWRVSRRRFAAQLDWLRENGYRSIGADELELFLADSAPLDERVVVLTFDDAYRDFYTNAWPLLREYGFHAMLFVVTSHVGGTSSWNRHLGDDQPLMSWEEIREVSSAGIEIGSHGNRHDPLSGLPPETLQHEAQTSKKCLEERLSRTVVSIAYPYGDTSAAVRHCVRNAGYRLGFGTATGKVTRASDPYALERLEITEDWIPEQLQL